MAAAIIAEGFADPVHDGQAVFRAVLDAMAGPGRVVDLPSRVTPPAPLNEAATAVCLALLDFETPLWLDEAASRAAEALRFHCGCPVVEAPEAAAFALIADPRRMPPLDAFNPGLSAYPDRSATLILQVETLRPGAGVRLSGPGIRTGAALEVAPVPDGFWEQVRRNHALYPRGVDLIFAAPEALAALPRSTAVAVVEE